MQTATPSRRGRRRLPEHLLTERRLLGQRLLQMRRRRGLTQRELARRAGCHRNTIAAYERGDYDPRPILPTLAAALGVPLAELRGDDGETMLLAHYRSLPPERRRQLLVLAFTFGVDA